MTDETLEKLLSEANQAAGNGNWEGAYASLLKASEISPGHIGILNGLGTCLVQLERLPDSIKIYEQIVQLSPDQPEAYCNLGVTNSLMGNLAAAEEAYLGALNIEPASPFALKGLAQVYVQQESRLVEGVKILTGLLNTYPQDIDLLLLLASVFERENQTEQALKLYTHVLNLQLGNQDAEEGIKRLAPPQPAVDLTRIAKPEHAEKLAGLKGLKKTEAATVGVSIESQARIAFYGGDELPVAFRLFVPVNALKQNGVGAKFSNKFSAEDLTAFDFFVFNRPQLTEDFINAFELLVSAGKKVVIDVDEDFHNLPEGHPGYEIFGKGNPTILKRLEDMIRKASLLTVPSRALMEHYKALARQVVCIPNGWDVNNPLWKKPSPPRKTVNIGWVDLPTERPNLMLVKKEIAGVLRKNPNAMFVVGGDLGSYEIFKDIVAEDQFAFIPFVSFDDYPLIFQSIDILISPLYGNPYNLAKPDLRLMEAGIRGIPWVASPIPAYHDWGEGGILARQSADWSKALHDLVGSVDLRRQLGLAGALKADQRKSQDIARTWLSTFHNLKTA